MKPIRSWFQKRFGGEPMREPLWWIWLTIFTRYALCGDDYFGYRLGDISGAWFVAGVVTRTCREIREGR